MEKNLARFGDSLLAHALFQFGIHAAGGLADDARGVFAGAVGWVDAAGDGEFAITIRSAVLHGDTVRLFAGAGIVAGSDPDAEVRETGAKLTTIARAIGLPEELLP